MDSEEFQLLLKFFKVLSDENRLRMVGYLSDQEQRVSDLADLLNLKEPTVSHHIARLRELGLVTLRVDGNNRYYRLNTDALEEMNAHLFNLEQINPRAIQAEEDAQWIETLDVSDEDKQVLKGYIFNRRLKQLPPKEKKLQAILRWLITYFEQDRIYDEKQVNEILSRFHEDFAGLRRELVDFGFLDRERDGSTYWVKA